MLGIFSNNNKNKKILCTTFGFNVICWNRLFRKINQIRNVHVCYYYKNNYYLFIILLYLVDIDVFQFGFEVFDLASSSRSCRGSWFVFSAGLLFPSHVTSERRLNFGRGMAQFYRNKVYLIWRGKFEEIIICRFRDKIE